MPVRYGNGLVRIFAIGRLFIYMENVIVSTWKGSQVTEDLVRKQILARWGEDDAKQYDPKHTCLTYNRWLDLGYQVKKGEKSLLSFIMIEKKDKDGKIVRKYPKKVHLFHFKQVEKI